MNHTLVATYRLQFRGETTFEVAADLAPYLSDLGISHLYASPVFAAVPGSTHGYDLVDYNRFEPELGGADGFTAMSNALSQQGLGLILDFVPNHMGVSPANDWWEDVLRWGRESRFASHFDIVWEAADKILVPVLPKPYGDALEGGDLSVKLDSENARLRFDSSGYDLPLDPRTYAQVFARMDHPERDRIQRRFAVASPAEAEDLTERLVAALSDPQFETALQAAINGLNADHDGLHALHEEQNWRLVWWRAGRERLTHRRFFEIADLIGVRQEIGRVFRDSHELVLRLARERRLDGIRIDHVDGVADPKGYLETLREAFHAIRRSPTIHVEKIMAGDERLRRDWAIEGSTGYVFIAALGGLYVDASREAPMTEAYHAFIDGSEDLEAMVTRTKRTILTHNLAGELAHLTRLAGDVAARGLSTRDFGPDTLSRSIVEVAAALPVYRTYGSVDGVPRADIAIIDDAVALAQSRRMVEPDEPLAFIGRLLKLEFPDGPDIAGALAFMRRFQQTTGAIMAKSLEDTAFYRYNRLIALNEVGNEPERYGASVDAFHASMRLRLEDQPYGLSATATHDTKRGEDARSRLYTLSEAPERWAELVEGFSHTLTPFRAKVGDGLISPDPQTEWGLYQSLLGVLPADFDASDDEARAAIAERLSAYAEKAVREAKRWTSWTAPDEAYEEALRDFVEAMLDRQRSGEFLGDFWTAVQRFVAAGVLTSLSQTLLKVAAPGVPDIYQGTEFYDFSLVDPDNRRPVDFAARRAFVAEGARPESLLADWRDGRVKAALLRRSLAARSRSPTLFTAGGYEALRVSGARADNVVAFARTDEAGRAAIVIAPRLCLDLLAGAEALDPAAIDWGDTRVALPSALVGRAFTDELTGETTTTGDDLPLADLLSRFPLALLATD